MVNERKLPTLKVGLILLSFALAGLPSAIAQDEGPSVTLMKYVSKAQEAMRSGRNQEARDEFRKAIGLAPKTPEYYIGLSDACYQMKEYDQVAFALQKVIELNPAMKDECAGEYGEALFHLGRYDEAIPLLKAGLRYIDSPAAKQRRTAIAAAPPVTPISTAPPDSVIRASAAPVEKKEAIPLATHDPASSAGWHSIQGKTHEVDINKFNQTLAGAIRSEGIVIAEYQGYEKSPNINFFHPPKAKFHISKILKGPPLNKDLPVRFEFKERSTSTPAPAGWKFSEDKMPAKGSSWIIFLEWCTPREGMFDTYEGSFGRLPADDENLNKVYAELEKHSNR
jgi:tetratricopeptide (TPR) repeat protein